MCASFISLILLLLRSRVIQGSRRYWYRLVECHIFEDFTEILTSFRKVWVILVYIVLQMLSHDERVYRKMDWSVQNDKKFQN